MGIRGEPELFLRRSLLFNAESMGCCCEAWREAWLGRMDDGVAAADRGTELALLSIEITDGFGLKVTFRPFRCASGELGAAAAEGRRGVLSVVLAEAIGNQLEEQGSSAVIGLSDPNPWGYIDVW